MDTLRCAHIGQHPYLLSLRPDGFNRSLTTQKQKGKVLIRFVVRRDGSLEKGSPLVVTGSGTRKLDDAAFLAIKDAAPFKGFPQELAGSNIALEFRFFYNLPVE